MIAGVDIGGTAIKFGIVDDEGKLVYQTSVPSILRDPQATLGQIEGLIREAPYPVHMVGVGITDNGQGGVATIIGVQNDEDSALLVDFETDGRVDALIHDDNQDGQIEGNEIHDVSGENLSTDQVVASYVEDAQNNGEVATVVNLSTGERFALNTNPGDDNIYASQSGDGADDYQPVADPEPVPEDVDPGFTDCSDATVDFVESDSATFDA